MPALTGSVLLNALLAAYRPIDTEWLPNHPVAWYILGLWLFFGFGVLLLLVAAGLIEHDVHEVHQHEAFLKAHDKNNPPVMKHAA